MNPPNPEENPMPDANAEPVELWEMHPFSEMRDHGLLWLINATVFHPRGFALAFDVEDDGTVTGWCMMGDGATCLALAALIVAVAMLVHLIGPHL